MNKIKKKLKEIQEKKEKILEKIYKEKIEIKGF